MAAKATSRRSFLRGAMTGSAAGVMAMTTVHAIGHAPAAHAAELGASHIDIGFCTDMSAHHVQALDLCERVLGRDTGGAVQSAATEVLRNQSVEIGMMRAWLTDWGASTAPPTTVMAWMAMGDGAGMPIADMPGYASPQELSALALTGGWAKGRMWLELMRAHHVGGVAMAGAAVELATEEKVLRLARTQVEVQSYEISQYDYLLATAYSEPS